MSVIRPANEDGRAFTFWETACITDSRLAAKFGVYGPEYRHFLQNNADQVYKESRKMNVCAARPCFLIPYPVTNAPRLIDPQDPQS
jgi:hypothetical protein